MINTVLGPQGYSRPPYGSFANKAPIPPVTIIAGPVYYIFEFTDVAAAQSDPVIGVLPYNEVLVFADVERNGVVPNPGFWCRVNRFSQGSLMGHPNLQVAFDVNRFVFTSRVPTDHIGIVVSNYDNFVPDGLRQGLVLTDEAGNFLTTEDGTVIVADAQH